MASNLGKSAETKENLPLIKTNNNPKHEYTRQLIEAAWI